MAKKKARRDSFGGDSLGNRSRRSVSEARNSKTLRLFQIAQGDNPGASLTPEEVAGRWPHDKRIAESIDGDMKAAWKDGYFSRRKGVYTMTPGGYLLINPNGRSTDDDNDFKATLSRFAITQEGEWDTPLNADDIYDRFPDIIGSPEDIERDLELACGAGYLKEHDKAKGGLTAYLMTSEGVDFAGVPRLDLGYDEQNRRTRTDQQKRHRRGTLEAIGAIPKGGKIGWMPTR
jgi:hypothetical protein